MLTLRQAEHEKGHLKTGLEGHTWIEDDLAAPFRLESKRQSFELFGEGRKIARNASLTS